LPAPAQIAAETLIVALALVEQLMLNDGRKCMLQKLLRRLLALPIAEKKWNC
jgi:hypothetical protein